MLDKTIISQIYEDVFRRIYHKEVDLFLCGGASSAKCTSYRDRLRAEIEKRQKKLCKDDVSIYYPEDLFSEILARKKTDLLSLEEILAENSDLIIIVCESPGSFTELGAFVNNDATCKKVTAFVQSKYKNDKSFINQGPIEYLRKHNTGCEPVQTFNQDIEEMCDKAMDIIGQTRRRLIRSSQKQSLSLISGQVCFIMLLLYFFDSLAYDELRKTVAEKYQVENSEESRFEILYQAAIKRIYKKGYLVKQADIGEYKLSPDGYFRVKRYIDSIVSGSNTTQKDFTENSEKTEDCIISGKPLYRSNLADGIRLNIMWKSYYQHG